MQGFHRTIILAGQTGSDGHTLARACLEDDFHHFRLEMTIDDSEIKSIQGTAIRFPYVTCPGAEDGLQSLVGTPLNAFSASVHRAADARLNCTHLLDLSGMCGAHILMGITRRRYDIFVSDRDNNQVSGKYRAQILRDHQLVLEWEAEYETIIAPEKFQGINLRSGFAKWAFNNLDSEQREAALALRRCSMISMGRAKNLDKQLHAEDWGFCYSQQKERSKKALRVSGTILDFNQNPGRLCRDDFDWIDFQPSSLSPITLLQENS
ncbi:DUF2889 domain-containing protein [Litorimonas sp.]|uniref:DUF2889 domain-containing protein n=1 Tax=Litorimonas sp. TaxID=1892381 RepID=UPI003A8585A0